MGAVPVPAMPWRILTLAVGLGCSAGAVVGFVRGLSHAPTLPFAVVEGAVLVGAPAALLGLLLTGVWSVGSRVHRHRR